MYPKIIAELSGNSGGSLQNCVQLIKEAIRLRVDAVKFQRFDPERLAAKRRANPLMERALAMDWGTEDLVELYRRTETPLLWWPTILDVLGGYPWVCSVFSLRDLEDMEFLDCPAYKIASFEITDLPLISACAATGKPLTVSVNQLATMEEVNAVVATSPRRLTFLHASDYYQDNATFRQHILREKRRYKWLGERLPPQVCDLGLSDHSPPDRIGLACFAAEQGADVVERHLRLPEVVTPDAPFSSTPEQFAQYMRAIEESLDAAAKQDTSAGS